MSLLSTPPVPRPSGTSQPTDAQKRAQTRLDELKRAFQRLIKRRPNVYEKQLLDRAALMTLRAESAVCDGKSSSNDIVRLDNAARRARADFERVCGLATKKTSTATLAQALRA
jgi:hypothetical protein